MKRVLITALLTVLFSIVAFAQEKSNDVMMRQIVTLKAEKTMTLSYDQGSNVSKLMAVAENVSSAEADRAGVRAMNFAVGAIYSGRAVKSSPDSFLLTFWVLSSKPRFGADHSLVVTAGQELIDLGLARYVARSRDNMEYLNFNMTRDQMKKIAERSNVSFLLGGREFSFTRGQLKIFADLILVTEVN